MVVKSVRFTPNVTIHDPSAPSIQDLVVKGESEPLDVNGSGPTRQPFSLSSLRWANKVVLGALIVLAFVQFGTLYSLQEEQKEQTEVQKKVDNYLLNNVGYARVVSVGGGGIAVYIDFTAPSGSLNAIQISGVSLQNPLVKSNDTSFFETEPRVNVQQVKSGVVTGHGTVDCKTVRESPSLRSATVLVTLAVTPKQRKHKVIPIGNANFLAALQRTCNLASGPVFYLE